MLFYKQKKIKKKTSIYMFSIQSYIVDLKIFIKFLFSGYYSHLKKVKINEKYNKKEVKYYQLQLNKVINI